MTVFGKWTKTAPADKPYELSFFGNPPVKYQQWHETFDNANAEAKRALSEVSNRNAYTGLIYGPDIPPNGPITVR